LLLFLLLFLSFSFFFLQTPDSLVMTLSLLRRSVLAVSIAALSLGGLSLQAQAQPATKKELVIGGTAGSNIDQLKAGIVPILEKKGYKVKLVEFNDYVQPNQALAQGSTCRSSRPTRSSTSSSWCKARSRRWASTRPSARRWPKPGTATA
jgi:hypothetical protein